MALLVYVQSDDDDDEKLRLNVFGICQCKVAVA